MSRSKRRFASGFTFLEFMFVLTLVGILSSIVFISLNGAREKAQDSKVKGQLSGLRGAAEVYYENTRHYDIEPTESCSSEFFSDSDSGMAEFTNPNNYPPGTNLICRSEEEAYAVSAVLPGTGGATSWCVDSMGNSFTINGLLSGTSCYSSGGGGGGYSYQYQTPYGYQTPYVYQTPYAYQYQYQTPSSYQYQTPSSYQYQTPYTYPTPPFCYYNAGSIISGGDVLLGSGASNAFEGSYPSALMSLYDTTEDQVTKEVYVGRYYSIPMALRSIKAIGTQGYTLSGSIQYSDDNEIWTNVGLSIFVPANNNSWVIVSLPVGSPHKYWRILDNKDDTYHQIDELEFYSCL